MNNSEQRQVYLNERASLIDAKAAQSKLFDRTAIALSGGALAISLTFVDSIVPEIRGGTLWILIIAWSCFCLALLSTLTSFLVSWRAFDRGVEILDRYFDSNEEKPEENEINKYVKLLNYASIITIFVGVVSLVIFSAVNIS